MTPLHQVGQLLRDWLAAVPLPAVRMLFVGTLLVLMFWVLSLPRSATTPAGGKRGWDEDLRVAACLALLIQVLIYAFL